MAHGIHADVEAVEPPRSDAVVDRAPGEADVEQLPVRHDAVLSVGQLGHEQVMWAVSSMDVVFETAHHAKVAGKLARVCVVCGEGVTRGCHLWPP